jgi:hypothetical protein
MDWMLLVEDRDQWLAVVNRVMNLAVCIKSGDLLNT